jgi:hypothetical protein
MKRYVVIIFIGLFSGLNANVISIEGDAFYVGRSKAPQNIIIEEATSAMDKTACNVSSQMGHEVGVIAKFGIIASPKENLQFRLSDWLNFSGILYAEDPIGITFPFNSTFNNYDWVNAQSARAYYNSTFISYDISYLYYPSPRWFNYFYYGYGAGAFYAKMGEDFKVRYFNNSDSSKYDIKAENSLYGGAFVFDVGSSPVAVFAWGFSGRVGVAGNMMQVRQHLDDVNQTVLIMSSAQNSLKPAYYIEFNPYLLWKPFPVVNLNVGYMIMYYKNVALAPGQINYNPATSQGIQHDDSIDFQGFYAGLSLNF